MKLTAGANRDERWKFAKVFPLSGVMEPRSSSYFVLQNNCIPSDLLNVVCGKSALCYIFTSFIKLYAFCDGVNQIVAEIYKIFVWHLHYKNIAAYQ